MRKLKVRVGTKKEVVVNYPDISVGAFRRRMTSAERIFLRKRLAEARIATEAGTSSAIQDNLIDFFDMLAEAGYVDVRDPTTAQGLDFLISQGWLTEARKNELLVPGTYQEWRNS